MNKKAALPAIILIVAALVFSGCTRSSEGLEVGRPAPAFKLRDLSGQEISLDRYKGKIVLLDFWATWCGPCRMTMPVLERLQKEYSSNLVLLAINLQESPDEVREYMRQQNLNSRVLLDSDGAVGEIYGAAQIPMQVLLDKTGIVREIQFGYHTIAQLRAKVQNLL